MANPQYELELDSNLSPLDALASQTRRLTIKKPSRNPSNSSNLIHYQHSNPSPSSSRPTLNALSIPNILNHQNRSRSPILSPEFSDFHKPLPRQLLQQHQTRDSAATFATDSTDYVWNDDLDDDDDDDDDEEEEEEEEEDEDEGEDDAHINRSTVPSDSNSNHHHQIPSTNLSRRPSTGNVPRATARAQASSEQVMSVYGHQESFDHHLNHPHHHPSESDEPLEVLNRNELDRQTWDSNLTSLQSDGSDSEAGWESARYASGHSVSSEDPFQYSHYETPRDQIGTKRPGQAFMTFPTHISGGQTTQHPSTNSTVSQTGRASASPISHIRNFSRPLRPPASTSQVPDLPTSHPPSEILSREPTHATVDRTKNRSNSTTTSVSSIETASSGATRRSLKSLFRNVRSESREGSPSTVLPSPLSPSVDHRAYNDSYQPPRFHSNVDQHRYMEPEPEPEPPSSHHPYYGGGGEGLRSNNKGKEPHRLSIYSLPPTDVSIHEGEMIFDKARYESRSPISISHPPSPNVPKPPLPKVNHNRQSMLPPAMAKTKASLQPRTIGKAGGPRTAQDYLQLGIEAHEQGEMERSAGLFERSAREGGGCGAGMLMWGLAQRHGWGCQVNETRAFKWLQKAAESVVEAVEDNNKLKLQQEQNKNKAKEEAGAMKEELVLAIYELGMCFMRGWGCKKDKTLAISYFELAAKLGDPDAQQELGFCYANGKGTKKDLKKAAKYYRMASKQGIEMMGSQWIWKSKYD
ncbi:hypothetical protein CROQUDRAFT_79235 [Cronartium quercuum f. sp. fusiforme G11]|uniref:HCP-like protein n=1 Tax=Cronartium quercuum f. sp. fusiforme G11 TaxID=708437 RepID=A0A9P6NK42_9BASI|nr:hypothetical protein CROQUDRAFT_79235 [Cronartium quercuum f. sp. fusiforme G11]